jgi:biotin transporter BioY
LKVPPASPLPIQFSHPSTTLSSALFKFWRWSQSSCRKLASFCAAGHMFWYLGGLFEFYCWFQKPHHYQFNFSNLTQHPQVLYLSFGDGHKAAAESWQAFVLQVTCSDIWVACSGSISGSRSLTITNLIFLTSHNTPKCSI